MPPAANQTPLEVPQPPSHEWSFIFWKGQFIFANFHLAVAMLPVLMVCYWQWFRKEENRVFPPMTLTPLPWMRTSLILTFVAVLIPVMLQVALWLGWVWIMDAP